MNLLEAFADYFKTISGTTLGQDLFIGQAPSTNKVNDPIWWITGQGGAVTLTNTTGERTKERILEIRYRNRDYKQVHDEVQEVEEILNCANCVQIDGYEIEDVTANVLFVDEDLDNEDRKVGAIQVNITLYQEC